MNGVEILVCEVISYEFEWNVLNFSLTRFHKECNVCGTSLLITHWSC